MRSTIFPIVLVVILAVFLTGCQPDGKKSFGAEDGVIRFSDTIPPPSEMTVDMVVSGRVSTMRHIDIVNVGKQIPYTYAGDRLSNTPGYSWYVSKHYALKTDFPDNEVRLYMKLLEMSYPHYVEIFGKEPPDIQNQRIPAVYSDTRFDVGVAMMDDGFTRPPNGGGETMYYNRTGYNFKSSREQHQRYIVIHESCHAFQMALWEYTGWTPIWYVEGVADSVAHHIYDPVKEQLTVMNFDRGCPMDYIRRGLDEYEKLDHPTIESLNKNKRFYRGLGFLLTHFMMDDPVRSHKFKIWRDELSVKELPASENLDGAHEVMVNVFGDWKPVEEDFAAWMQSIDKTFHVAGGPWEQNGNAYFVRHYNSDNGTPRLDFLLKPGGKPYFSPFKVDQPSPDPCPLVLPVARGVDEPTIGMKIEFLKDHICRGKLGIGLGLKVTDVSRKNLELDKKRQPGERKNYNPDDDELYEILIERGDTLVFDGRDLEGERLKFAFPQPFITVLKAGGTSEIGMSVTIKRDKLSVRLATGTKSGALSIKQEVPIDKNIRDKLLNRPMALLAQDIRHQMTPYFDDGRDLNPHPVDLKQPAPRNVFRNPADQEITRLTKAVWLLGDEAPDSVKKILDTLLELSDKSPEKQAEGVALLAAKRVLIAAEIADIAEEGSANAESALAAYSGAHFRLEWDPVSDTGKRSARAVLYNPGDLPLTGTVQVAVIPDNQVEEIPVQPVSVPAAGSHEIPFVMPPYRDEMIRMYRIKGMLAWAGQSFKLHFEDRDPYPWGTVEIVEPAKIDNGEIKISVKIRATLNNETRGDLTFDVLPASIVEKEIVIQKVDLKPYEVKIFTQTFKLKDGVIPDKLFGVRVTFDGSLDGEPLRIHRRSVFETIASSGGESN